jgi:2,5-dioxopentanoate dehydrogenase
MTTPLSNVGENIAETAPTCDSGSSLSRTLAACTATERAIVHESVYDEFVEELVNYAESLDIGPGIEDPDMGAHVSEDEFESTLESVETAKDEGATIEYGGGQPEGAEYETGYYVEPMVVTGLESDATVMQEEVFGPFVGVLKASDTDEVIGLANDVEFGLSASIITDNHTEANRFVDEVDFGVVKVNEPSMALQLHVPFGGMNASSSETYREQGDEGLDYFTIIKPSTTTTKHPLLDRPIARWRRAQQAFNTKRPTSRQNLLTIGRCCSNWYACSCPRRVWRTARHPECGRTRS